MQDAVHDDMAHMQHALYHAAWSQLARSKVESLIRARYPTPTSAFAAGEHFGAAFPNNSNAKSNCPSANGAYEDRVARVTNRHNDICAT